jgi:hypothetical protein
MRGVLEQGTHLGIAATNLMDLMPQVDQGCSYTS